MSLPPEHEEEEEEELDALEEERGNEEDGEAAGTAGAPRVELLWGPWEVLSMVCSSCR